MFQGCLLRCSKIWGWLRPSKPCNRKGTSKITLFEMEVGLQLNHHPLGPGLLGYTQETGFYFLNHCF